MGPEVTSSSSVYLCASFFEATMYVPLCPLAPLRHASRPFTAANEGPALSPKNDDQFLPFPLRLTAVFIIIDPVETVGGVKDLLVGVLL